MGQQQVHQVGIYDSKKRGVPQAVAMVGICTSGQQASSGSNPVCLPFPTHIGQCQVRQRAPALQFEGNERCRCVDADPGVGYCIDQCWRTSCRGLRKQLSSLLLAQTVKPAVSGQLIEQRQLPASDRAPHQADTGGRLHHFRPVYADLGIQRGTMVNQDEIDM
jgi:hypothetical protein